MQDLEKLFLDELADIYHAEKQLTKALPKMMKAAESEALESAFEEHLSETEDHVQRCEEVFELFGRKPKSKICEAMKGLVMEGNELARSFKGNSALDAGLICAAQKVEHYEIVSYGCLCTWAREMGHNEALALLKQNLADEKAADKKLTELAETSMNVEAALHDTRRGGGLRRTMQRAGVH